MTTRNRALRGEEKEFIGRVRKWENTPATLGTGLDHYKFLVSRWQVTETKAPPLEGPRFPDLVAVPTPTPVKPLQQPIRFIVPMPGAIRSPDAPKLTLKLKLPPQSA